MIETITNLTFYEKGMLFSNGTSMILTFILLALNIWWHVQKK